MENDLPPIMAADHPRRFERGLTLWTEQPDRFYVFFEERHEFVLYETPYHFMPPETLAACEPFRATGQRPLIFSPDGRLLVVGSQKGLTEGGE